MKVKGEVAEQTPAAIPFDSPSTKFFRNWDEFTLNELAKCGMTNFKKETIAKVSGWVRQHAEELAGPNPSPIERTLAETAAVCCFLMRYQEFVGGIGTTTLAQAAWMTKKIESAHRRYLATLRTLAMIRRLELPAIQVNIAQNQAVALAMPEKRGSLA